MGHSSRKLQGSLGRDFRMRDNDLVRRDTKESTNESCQDDRHQTGQDTSARVYVRESRFYACRETSASKEKQDLWQMRFSSPDQIIEWTSRLGMVRQRQISKSSGRLILRVHDSMEEESSERIRAETLSGLDQAGQVKPIRGRHTRFQHRTIRIIVIERSGVSDFRESDAGTSAVQLCQAM